MKALDLFSGLGGFSIGLERAGIHTGAFCEILPQCRAHLSRRWPGIPIFDDVRELTAARLGWRPELIAGGFPCQPHSSASRGRKVAVDLWPEFLRIVTEVRPNWVAAENVPGIGYDGVDRVCRDLEDWDYTVWPFDLDTALPQRQRGRIRFIWLAHSNRDSQLLRAQHAPVAVLRQTPRRRATDHTPPLGVDDGFPGRMDRIHALGNAITPTIAELIGRAIVRAELALTSEGAHEK